MMEAYMCMRLGWSVSDYRSTPAHIIDYIKFIWHLEAIVDKAARRGK